MCASVHKEAAWTLLLLLYFKNFASSDIVYSISEEAKKGTVVGNIAKDLNINTKELASDMFEIVSRSLRKYFEADLRSGTLFVNERIDREEICASNQICSLNLEAIAHRPLRMYRFQVNLLDINDNSPSFSTQRFVLDVTENAFRGDRFPLPLADDEDVGINSVRNYTLSPNEHFSLDVQSGAQSVSAELVLQKALDREKQSSLELVLTAVDGGRPARSGTLQIIVNVMDVNDNSPTFSALIYNVHVIENTPSGAHVVTVHATDLDEGLNGHILYSLVEHINGNNIFAVDPATGEITVKGKVDYEENTSFEIMIQARDQGVPSRSSQCKVLVEVVDVNDNAPEIMITQLAEEVREDTEQQTPVAVITLSDLDNGKGGEIDCLIMKGIPFRLESTYNNYYSLVVDGPLDRENVSSYNITVTAIDGGTPPLSTSSDFVVHISDVNDNAPKFPTPTIDVYFKENGPVGGHIVTVHAHDVDVNENAHVSYTLVEIHGERLPLSSWIYINSLTGEIYSLQSFNYEELKLLQFHIQATDSGVPPLSSIMTVNVFIQDENDSSPVILPPYSDARSVNTETIPYIAEAGYLVAKISAIDADSGYNALLSFHLSEPKGTDLFRIRTSTGEIRTKRQMGENDLKIHPLLITVSDNGEPALSTTVSVDVIVVDNADNVLSSFRKVSSKKDAQSDLNLYLFFAVVSVSVIFLLTVISVAVVKCRRTSRRFSSTVITSHSDGSWSYMKSSQQYDVCLSLDTLKPDVVVFPSPCSPTEVELISLNGRDSITQTGAPLNHEKVSKLSLDYGK